MYMGQLLMKKWRWKLDQVIMNQKVALKNGPWQLRVKITWYGKHHEKRDGSSLYMQYAAWFRRIAGGVANHLSSKWNTKNFYGLLVVSMFLATYLHLSPGTCWKAIGSRNTCRSLWQWDNVNFVVAFRQPLYVTVSPGVCFRITITLVLSILTLHIIYSSQIFLPTLLWTYIVASVFALTDKAEAKIDYKNVWLLGIKYVILYAI